MSGVGTDAEAETTDDEEQAEESAPSPAFASPPELPDFEDRPVKGVVTSISGTSQRITRAIHYGEKVYAVVALDAQAINHKKTKDGLKRHQSLVTEDFWELDDTEARDIITRKRQEALERGELDGQLEIGDGTSGVVDGSGVALTPQEVAEAQGLPAGGPCEPWMGYDESSAAEVIAAVVRNPSVDQIQQAHDYEQRGKKRTTVIEACERTIAALEAEG